VYSTPTQEKITIVENKTGTKDGDETRLLYYVKKKDFEK
jgi:hypothetical protein